MLAVVGLKFPEILSILKGYQSKGTMRPTRIRTVNTIWFVTMNSNMRKIAAATVKVRKVCLTVYLRPQSKPPIPLLFSSFIILAFIHFFWKPATMACPKDVPPSPAGILLWTRNLKPASSTAFRIVAAMYLL